MRGSVQYDVPKVKFNLDLDKTRFVESVELVSYTRRDDFAVSSARLVTSVDGRTWEAPQQLTRLPGAGGHEFARWQVVLNREVRFIGLAAFRKDGCKRMLLGEIFVRTRSEAGRRRVPTPLQVKQVFDRALLTNGVEFLTGSYVTDVLRDASADVAGVVIANRSGRQAIQAKTVIDATERATVARLAGVPFSPYPSGPATFTRIVISGEEPKGEGMTVRKLPGEYRVGVQWSRKAGKVDGIAWECTLSIPMRDGSYASFAEAEQIARDRTFTKQQLDAADTLFQVPSDHATGNVPHLLIACACARIGLRTGRRPRAGAGARRGAAQRGNWWLVAEGTGGGVAVRRFLRES